MKLTELITEASSENYMVQLKDGGGFNVLADSTSDARAKAKDRLRSGQVIDKVIKDTQQSSNMDDKKERLTTYIANHRKIQQSPSIQKTFTRRIKQAQTSDKLQEVSDDIDEFVAGDVDDKKKKDEKKKDEKTDD